MDQQSTMCCQYREMKNCQHPHKYILLFILNSFIIALQWYGNIWAREVANTDYRWAESCGDELTKYHSYADMLWVAEEMAFRGSVSAIFW
jgi:hypothetical protein